MRTAIRRVPPGLALVSLALLLLALAARPAHGAIAYVHETYPEFESQLSGGQIKEVTINKRLRTLRITLTDGRYVLAQYAPHEEPHVLRALRERHVHVAVLTAAQAKKEQGKRPVHHKLRYIIGGILIAVVVIVGGVVLYNRRRRASRDHDYGYG
jgi:ATP-dependent Zn protease